MSLLTLKRPCLKRIERKKPEAKSEGASQAHPFGPNGKVLAICDVENIWISAKRSGLSICFTRFHDHLQRELGATHLHAVCTHDPNGCLPVPELKASPWDLHTREVSWIQRDGEWIRQANSDTLFAALAGSMVSQLAPEGLILLTGDGALACDTAKIIRTTLPNPPRILAMGIE
ncbi:MAG: hypothetical protein AAFY03_05545, partial [Pseudomonadota bacterium]